MGKNERNRKHTELVIITVIFVENSQFSVVVENK